MSPFWIPVLGIMCGIIAIVAGVGQKVFRDWLTYKREESQALSNQTAEKSAQYASHTERLSSKGCGCWRGSSPTRASMSPTRSSGCATTG
jgi:hypothetical protein